MEAEKQLVKVMHVINPGKFYACDLTRPREIGILRRLESKIQIYCSQISSRQNVQGKSSVKPGDVS